jgi:serine/threonine-protein kinase
VTDEEPTLRHRGPATLAAQRAGDLCGCRLADKYELFERLGAGATGAVYRGRRLTDGLDVAIKVLDAPSANAEWKLRFHREGAAAARLSHPNTVRLLELGEEDDGLTWMAMEHAAGPTLMDVIEREGRLRPERALRILDQVAASLAEAHEKGLVHRDVKPTNIVLTQVDGEEVAKVLDFGLVKDLSADVDLTHSGVALGSPSFMAPEQVLRKPIDARADLYALGVVTYGMLTGRAPFEHESKHQLMMMQVKAPIPSLQAKAPDLVVPESVAFIVQTCLAKDRESRFADAYQLRKAVRRALAELSGEAPHAPMRLNEEGKPEVSEPPARSRTFSFLAGFFLLAALGGPLVCGALGLLWWALG